SYILLEDTLDPKPDRPIQANNAQVVKFGDATTVTMAAKASTFVGEVGLQDLTGVRRQLIHAEAFIGFNHDRERLVSALGAVVFLQRALGPIERCNISAAVEVIPGNRVLIC